MLADLPLLDQATLALIDKLHRIFERENMAVSMVVEKIDHRRQRRGFAAAGRPRHQNQPGRIG